MLNWLRRLLGPAPSDAPEPAPNLRDRGFFAQRGSNVVGFDFAATMKKSIQKTPSDFSKATDADDGSRVVMAMDDADFSNPSLKGTWALQSTGVPPVLIDWYASQGFIGYQMCAVLAQHWLIDKACTMPAKDAMRNGWEITVNDGTKIEPEVFAYMAECDKFYKIKENCVELIRYKRIYGIRIALFKIKSDDPNFYTNPFNPDGITAGSYEGIAQVDPYWITPELDREAAADPSSIHFYEPTYWRINGKRYHRSHLIVVRDSEVPDVLKPTYYYGGIPLPQRIYERVYAAERTANEAPQLAMSKRSTVIEGVDLSAAAGNQNKLNERMEQWAYLRDNYGIKLAGGDEEVKQFDTTLNDFDELIMTQYQLVAAIAEQPATKLLGTVPKGFNSTGDYEQDSYHEMLESLQEHDARPLIERHLVCVMRSQILPRFKVSFKTTITFNEVDSETSAEKADRTLKEAQRDKEWALSGAIDGIDIRNRLIKDEDSGYSGIEEAIPEGPRPATVIDPGAEKTAPNAPMPNEEVPPGGGAPHGS